MISVVMFLLLLSCYSYEEYIKVQEQRGIPEGSSEIIVQNDIETVKNAFKNSQMLITEVEGGYKTEKTLLDEGTRAMYKLYEYEGATKVVPYWGITDKVKRQMAAISYEMANLSDTKMKRLTYDRDKGRTKKVFDYAVQILKEANLDYTPK